MVDTSNSRLQSYDLTTTAAWAYNETGNMVYNDGVAYTYRATSHAVTQAGSSSYVYDANGNMTARGSQALTWDVENRLTAAGGATFTYDGDGARVKKAESGQTTLYINKYYEKSATTGEATLYYYHGDKLVAFKTGNELRYVSQDHLTGTTLTTDVSGEVVGTVLYSAWGQTRAATGSIDRDKKFTGQRLDGTGLYYYGARYYDPALARFVSADTIVPSFANPQSLNRYSYVLNNPLRYVDASGHQGEEGSGWELVQFPDGSTYWVQGDDIDAALQQGGVLPEPWDVPSGTYDVWSPPAVETQPSLFFGGQVQVGAQPVAPPHPVIVIIVGLVAVGTSLYEMEQETGVFSDAFAAVRDWAQSTFFAKSGKPSHSRAEYDKHANNLDDARRALENLRVDMENARGAKKAKEIKNAIREAQKDIRGHEREMRQKWPGGQPK